LPPSHWLHTAAAFATLSPPLSFSPYCRRFYVFHIFFDSFSLQHWFQLYFRRQISQLAVIRHYFGYAFHAGTPCMRQGYFIAATATLRCATLPTSRQRHAAVAGH